MERPTNAQDLTIGPMGTWIDNDSGLFGHPDVHGAHSSLVSLKEALDKDRKAEAKAALVKVDLDVLTIDNGKITLRGWNRNTGDILWTEKGEKQSGRTGFRIFADTPEARELFAKIRAKRDELDELEKQLPPSHWLSREYRMSPEIFTQKAARLAEIVGMLDEGIQPDASGLRSRRLART